MNPDEIKLEILQALHSENNRLGKFMKPIEKYGDVVYSIVDELMNRGYIINMGVDTAADGSKMYSIMATTKVTPKGVSFIQQKSKCDS